MWKERFEGHGIEEAEILSWGNEEDHERELGLCDGSNSEEREKDRGANEEEEAILGELFFTKVKGEKSVLTKETHGIGLLSKRVAP